MNAQQLAQQASRQRFNQTVSTVASAVENILVASPVSPIISAVHPTGEEWLADAKHTLPLIRTLPEMQDIMQGEAIKLRKYPGAIQNQARVLFNVHLKRLKSV